VFFTVFEFADYSVSMYKINEKELLAVAEITGIAFSIRLIHKAAKCAVGKDNGEMNVYDISVII